MTEPQEPVDPFSPEELRADAFTDISVERVLLTIPVRKPNRHEFFRVHPGQDYVVDGYVYERNAEFDREVYWVPRQFRGQLADDLRWVRIFLCVNRQQTAFLWPAKLPSDDNGAGRRWAESALEIAELAETHWVRMGGKRDLGAYEPFKAKGNLGEPVWPDKPMSDLLRLGFKGDRVIDSPTHPVLLELTGEL